MAVDSDAALTPQTSLALVQTLRGSIGHCLDIGNSILANEAPSSLETVEELTNVVNKLAESVIKVENDVGKQWGKSEIFVLQDLSLKLYNLGIKLNANTSKMDFSRIICYLRFCGSVLHGVSLDHKKPSKKELMNAMTMSTNSGADLFRDNNLKLAEKQLNTSKEYYDRLCKFQGNGVLVIKKTSGECGVKNFPPEMFTTFITMCGFACEIYFAMDDTSKTLASVEMLENQLENFPNDSEGRRMLIDMSFKFGQRSHIKGAHTSSVFWLKKSMKAQHGEVLDETMKCQMASGYRMLCENYIFLSSKTKDLELVHLAKESNLLASGIDKGNNANTLQRIEVELLMKLKYPEEKVSVEETLQSLIKHDVTLSTVEQVVNLSKKYEIPSVGKEFVEAVHTKVVECGQGDYNVITKLRLLLVGFHIESQKLTGDAAMESTLNNLYYDHVQETNCLDKGTLIELIDVLYEASVRYFKLENLGDAEIAISWAYKFSTFSPVSANMDFTNRLASCMSLVAMKQGKTTEALEFAITAHESMPRCTSTMLLYFRAALECDDEPQAIKILDKITSFRKSSVKLSEGQISNDQDEAAECEAVDEVITEMVMLAFHHQNPKTLMHALEVSLSIGAQGKKQMVTARCLIRVHMQNQDTEPDKLISFLQTGIRAVEKWMELNPSIGGSMKSSYGKEIMWFRNCAWKLVKMAGTKNQIREAYELSNIVVKCQEMLENLQLESSTIRRLIQCGEGLEEASLQKQTLAILCTFVGLTFGYMDQHAVGSSEARDITHKATEALGRAEELFHKNLQKSEAAPVAEGMAVDGESDEDENPLRCTRVAAVFLKYYRLEAQCRLEQRDHAIEAASALLVMFGTTTPILLNASLLPLNFFPQADLQAGLALSMKILKHALETFGGAEIEAWLLRDVVVRVVGEAQKLGVETELECVRSLNKVVAPLGGHGDAKVALMIHCFNRALHYEFAHRPGLAKGLKAQAYFMLEHLEQVVQQQYRPAMDAEQWGTVS